MYIILKRRRYHKISTRYCSSIGYMTVCKYRKRLRSINFIKMETDLIVKIIIIRTCLNSGERYLTRYREKSLI